MIGYDRVEDAYTPMYSEDQLACHCDPETTCPYHRGLWKSPQITVVDYWETVADDTGYDPELIAEIQADVDSMFDTLLWDARQEANG